MPDFEVIRDATINKILAEAAKANDYDHINKLYIFTKDGNAVKICDNPSVNQKVMIEYINCFKHHWHSVLIAKSANVKMVQLDAGEKPDDVIKDLRTDDKLDSIAARDAVVFISELVDGPQRASVYVVCRENGRTYTKCVGNLQDLKDDNQFIARFSIFKLGLVNARADLLEFTTPGTTGDVLSIAGHGVDKLLQIVLGRDNYIRFKRSIA